MERTFRNFFWPMKCFLFWSLHKITRSTDRSEDQDPDSTHMDGRTYLSVFFSIQKNVFSFCSRLNTDSRHYKIVFNTHQIFFCFIGFQFPNNFSLSFDFFLNFSLGHICRHLALRKSNLCNVSPTFVDWLIYFCQTKKEKRFNIFTRYRLDLLICPNFYEQVFFKNCEV